MWQSPSDGARREIGDVDTPHGRLRYERAGSGPVLVLVAGGPGGSLRSLGTAFDVLADVRTLIYVDNIGRGHSDGLPRGIRHSPQRDACDIEALREALGIERIDLLGHSYGGYVALAYAGRYGDRTDRLVLSSAGHGFRSWQDNIDSYAAFVRTQYPEVWEQLLILRADGVKSSDPRYQRLNESAIGDLYWYDLANATKRPPTTDPAEDFREDVYFDILGDDPEVEVGGTMASFDARPTLARLRLPTLITAGRYDRIAAPHIALEMSRLVPEHRAQLMIFERSGHAPWIEEADAYFRRLRAFLLADPHHVGR
jgi:proline iminopeptidase